MADAIAALRTRSAGALAVSVTAVALLVQCALRATTVLHGLPLALAVAHNALAAFSVLAAVSAVFQSRSADEASVSAACQMVTSI